MQFPITPQDVSHRPVVPQCPPSRRKHQSPAPRRTQPADGHPKFRTFHSRSKQISQPKIPHRLHQPSPTTQNSTLPSPKTTTPTFSPIQFFDSTTSHQQHHSPNNHRALSISILILDTLSSSRALRKQHHTSPFTSPRSHRENHNRFASPDRSKQAIPSPTFLSFKLVLTETQPLHSLFSFSSSCPEPVTLSAILLLLLTPLAIFSASSNPQD